MTLAFQCHTSASQDRLEQLIAERLAPGADKPAIDQRIWDLFGETWAVMYTDLAGFSRGIADFGVTHFLQVIYESQRLLLPPRRSGPTPPKWDQSSPIRRPSCATKSARAPLREPSRRSDGVLAGTVAMARPVA